MGPKQSRTYRPVPFNRENWQKTEPISLYHKNQQKPLYGSFHLYRNILTDQIVQEYQLYFYSQQELQQYLEMYEWREREDALVKGKFLSVQQGREWCGGALSVKVYIEHTLLRLSDIQDIPYPQNLYVILASLSGFEKLYSKVGYFKPSEDLICVDQDGRVKTWLNHNLSLNHPFRSSDQEALSTNLSRKSQQAMVKQIISLIQLNTIQDNLPSSSFSQYLADRHKDSTISFKSARNILTAYAHQNNTQIPQQFESVLKLFHQTHPTFKDDQYLPHFSEKIQHQQSIFPLEISQPLSQSPIQRHITRIPSHDKIQTMNKENRSISHTITPVYSHKIHSLKSSDKIQPLNNATQPIGFSLTPSFSSQQTRFFHPISTEPRYTNLSKIKVNFHYPQTQQQRIQPISQPNSSYIHRIPQRSNIRISEYQQPYDRSRLVYCDTNEVYQLDEEIAQDIIKYLIV